MKYVTGTYALNIPCSLDTEGDWHQSALDWSAPRIRNTEDAFFGEWGLEEHQVPSQGAMPVANTIRAILDLLEEGYYSSAQGMKDSFIANDDYTPLLFDMVVQLEELPNWEEIDRIMGREYLCEWLDYKDARHG